jgi:hypothetical protein
MRVLRHNHPAIHYHASVSDPCALPKRRQAVLQQAVHSLFIQVPTGLVQSGATTTQTTVKGCTTKCTTLWGVG